jgi:hypothetical protein
MDADYSNPGSFANGELILWVAFTANQFFIETDNTDSFLGCSGNIAAEGVVLGGTLANRLDPGCIMNIVGQFSVCSTTWNPPAGFVGFGSGQTKLDANCPVPVENKTWGAIKKQYGDDQ